MAKKPRSERRDFLKTLAVSSTAGLLGTTTVTANDVGEDDYVCPSGCDGEMDYPFTMSEVDEVSENYYGGDYSGTVGLHGRYYGSYTNPQFEDSGYLHDFVISGSTLALSKPEDSNSWNADNAINSQTAVIDNHKPQESSIVSVVNPSSDNEWVGASKADSDYSQDNYIEAMTVAVETVIGEVSQKAGYAIAAKDFVNALTNTKDEPDNEDIWEISWDYAATASSTSCCSNTVRFAMTSPSVGDEIDVTTRQDANIPTVNNSDPYSELRWVMETDDEGGGVSTSAVTFDSSTKVAKNELPPYKEVQQMAERGDVHRVMLPMKVTSSTSDS